MINFNIFRMDIDWRNPLDREEFERSLKDHRGRRAGWRLSQGIVWAVQIFLLPLLVIAVLYGGSAYYLVQDELDLREREEERRAGEV